MQTLVIGDIHGCAAELHALLEVAALGPEDRIISIGDLIDRGPEPAAVLATFRQRPGAAAVMGNHERKHLRSARGEIRPAASQTLTRAMLGEEAYDEALGYLADLPRMIELPEARLVHGFWEPGLPPEWQEDSVLIGTMSGEQRLREEYPWPWYEHYDGDRPLIVGHRDYTGTMQPLIWRDRVYGLDTRCCYGGWLTGLLLPSFRIVQVKSRGDHWQALRAQHGITDE